MKHAARWVGVLACAALAAGCGEGSGGRLSPTGPRLTGSPVVVINGPSTVRPNVTCFFAAAASDGTPPYTYAWTQHFGSGSSDGDNGWYASSSTSYSVSVTITDANAETATASRSVSVNSNAAACTLP
ncbi:MAG TPA: hypothetical protein VF541_04265 [Longimicrobium sp.]